MVTWLFEPLSRYLWTKIEYWQYVFYFSGYDTWHDASQKGRSVGGIVATINPLLSRYVSFYFITYGFIIILHS